MANDRPLFDDEELPAWLTDGGITHGSVGNQPSSDVPQPEADLPWLTGDTPQPGETPAVPISADEMPPWMQNVAPVEPAQTDPKQIDWGQPAASTPEVPQSRTTATGALPWRQGVSDVQPTASTPQDDLGIVWD